MSQLKTLTKSESYLLGLLASSANNNPFDKSVTEPNIWALYKSVITQYNLSSSSSIFSPSGLKA